MTEQETSASELLVEVARLICTICQYNEQLSESPEASTGLLAPQQVEEVREMLRQADRMLPEDLKQWCGKMFADSPFSLPADSPSLKASVLLAAASVCLKGYFHQNYNPVPEGTLTH